jgi:hypothetical protein
MEEPYPAIVRHAVSWGVKYESRQGPLLFVSVGQQTKEFKESNALATTWLKEWAEEQGKGYTMCDLHAHGFYGSVPFKEIFPRIQSSRVICLQNAGWVFKQHMSRLIDEFKGDYLFMEVDSRFLSTSQLNILLDTPKGYDDSMFDNYRAGILGVNMRTWSSDETYLRLYDCIGNAADFDDTNQQQKWKGIQWKNPNREEDEGLGFECHGHTEQHFEYNQFCSDVWCKTRPEGIIYPDVGIINTARKGRGVIALETIKKDDFVLEVYGVSQQEEDRTIFMQEDEYINTMKFDDDLNVTVQGVGSLVNHCCRSVTCTLERFEDLHYGTTRMFLRASRTINPGEELTYCYSVKPALCDCVDCLEES